MKNESKMLEIRKSNICGKGVYTLDLVKKGERVFRFSNKIRKINHKQGCHCKICRRCINLRNNLWLYPEKDSFGWFLNHSCRSNCYSKGRYIYSLRKINAHEEITIDYSTTNIDKKWKNEMSL
ncbi:MAG: SET domain-containing protein [Nanoarchaeota archaeon]